jgi:hypothetical protein
MSGIVAKCIAAPKAKTRELAVQIALMYIEIEKFEAVQEEILKGMEHKNPKIVSACVSAITQALRYGYILFVVSHGDFVLGGCFFFFSTGFYSPCRPWPSLMDFSIHRHLVGLLGWGISPMQGLYRHTGQRNTETRSHTSMP